MARRCLGLENMGRLIPHVIALGPLGDYVCAPSVAFKPITPRQINETYPLLKGHKVIATGTKTECYHSLALIRKEERSTRDHVKLSRAIEILLPYIAITRS